MIRAGQHVAALPRIVERGLTVNLDLMRADSYAGSGQQWSDTKGLSHMNRGATSGAEGSDPTFNAGVPNYWSTDAGDYFTSVNANAGTLVRTMGRSDTPFTLEVWGYMTSSSTATDILVGNVSTAPNNNAAVRADITTADRLAYFDGAANAYSLIFAQTLSQWNQWVWTILPDGATTCRVYENLTEKASGTVTTTWAAGDSTGNFTIWATSGGVIRALANWRLAVVRLYNRILPFGDIALNFNAYRGYFGL